MRKARILDDQLKRRGRPSKSRPKQSTTLRLSAVVLEFFKAGGKGWQSKIDAVLKKHVEERRLA